MGLVPYNAVVTCNLDVAGVWDIILVENNYSARILVVTNYAVAAVQAAGTCNIIMLLEEYWLIEFSIYCAVARVQAFGT
jgi:hypothetical protein